MAEKKTSLKNLASQLSFKPELIWDKVTANERKAIDETSARYLDFLNKSKTERALLHSTAEILSKMGLVDGDKKSSKKGAFWIHQGKQLGAFIPGKKSPREGFNLIVAHGDSPRLDLKPKCVYEDSESGFGLLKTNLYGGLKKFHWLSRPLALWGFCALADGRTVDIVWGEDPTDPVLTIPDLLPHLDRKVQRDKKAHEIPAAEKLNLLATSIPLGTPEDKDRLKLAVLKILYDRWGIGEEDLISSELEIVPAGPARYLGLDASLVGGYGQDDRLAVFCALEAISQVKTPDRPTLFVIFDREEIGSYGSTGAASNYLDRLAAQSFQAAGLEPNWHDVLDALKKSNGLSADVEGALDPAYHEVHDSLNAARLGYGPCLVRYTGGTGKYGASEAGAEYVAKIRGAFASGEVSWQSSLLGKQEEGGGGTEALYMAAYGMGVLDCGPPLLGMHSPFEVSSKADIWMTGRAYASFLTIS